MKHLILFILILSYIPLLQAQNCNGREVFSEDFGTGFLNTGPAYDAIVGHDYQNNPPPDDGEYTITRSTDNWQSFAQSFWTSVDPPSSGFSNYFLVVNAAYGAQPFLRYNLQLCQYTQYEISFEAINMFQAGRTMGTNAADRVVNIVRPDLAVYINGRQVADLGEITQSGRWETVKGTFTTPRGSNFVLEIWNTAPGELFDPNNPVDKDWGRDFAMDDLSIRECGLAPIVLNETICEGESFELNGQFYTQEDTYRETGTENGCPFDITLNLEVAQRDETPVRIPLCAGEMYQGQVYTESTTLPAQNLTNAAGCDSLVVVEIDVSPSYNLSETPSVCRGESVAGIAVFQDTTIIMQAQSIAGCDSITTYDVSIREPITEDISAEICPNDSYSFNTQTLTEAGNYSARLLASNGCDSIVNLTLSLLPTITNPIMESICAGESYFFAGQNRTTADVYMDTQTTASGCDSTTVLTLVVNEPTANTVFVDLCEGSEYQGETYTENTTLTDLLVNTAGCDSTLTTEIRVTPLYDESFNESICAGESVQGIAVFQDTTIVLMQQSQAGCDSISTFIVNVNQAETNSFDWQICEGESYTLGNQSYDEAGEYTAFFTTQAGCDSVVTVNLSILDAINNPINVQICQGESYEFAGQMLSESDTYTDTQTTASGCDSTTTLTLVVAEPTTETIFVELCEGAEYQGETYTENTTLTDLLVNTASCDSTLTTEIRVTPLYDESFNESICAGESVQGIAVFQDTTIVLMQQSQAGCDSISTFIVDVNQAVTNDFDWQICEGESYQLGSQTLTENGTYTELLSTQAGCDSLVTVSLQVLTSINIPLDVTICEGESYEFAGQNISEGGTYTDTQTTASGCDSTTTLTLVVAAPTTETILVELCEGAEYQGETYTENATLTETLMTTAGCDSTLTTEIRITSLYEETFNTSVCAGESVQGIAVFQDTTIVLMQQSQAGCDSISTFIVQVNEAVTNTFDWQICEGESYQLGSQTLTENGTYTELLSTQAGCDSLVTVSLQVLTSINIPLDVTICEGESYEFAGQNISEGGTYTDTQTTASGCDSTTTLTLVVAAPTTETILVELCEGAEYQGATYTEDATLTEMLNNVAGCDSTLTTEIRITSRYDETFNESVCAGESVQGIAIFQDTTIVLMQQSQAGCDSISTFIVQVNEAVTNTFDWQICEGESYQLGSQTLTENGTYTELLATQAGCDSLVMVNLQVLTSINNPLDVTICEGEIYEFAGQNLSEGGTYVDMETTASGCDSTTTLTLVVAEPTTETILVELCEGAEYQGETYTEDATLTEMLNNVAGCDSTLTTEIRITSRYDETFNESICAGESVQGIAVFQDTTIVLMQQSQAGCDSISTFIVDVNQAVTNTFDWQICEGESYQLGSQTLTADGTFTELLSTENGCDSLVTVNLVVLTSINNPLNVTICEGESYEFAGQTLSESDTYTDTQTTASGCDSTTTLTLVVAAPTTETILVELCEGAEYQGATYTEDATLTEMLNNVAGCDSTLTTEIRITSRYDETFNESVCAGESVQGIAIFQDTTIVLMQQSQAGCDSISTFIVQVNEAITNNFDWQICEGESYQLGSQTLTEDGIYTELLSTVNGCDSLVNVNLQVLTSINNPLDVTICEGESYEFAGQTLNEGGTYTDTQTTASGCDSTTTLTLTINEASAESISIMLCEGESYQGESYTEDATLTQTLVNAAGCDSILITEILVTPISNETQQLTLCVGDDFEGITIQNDTTIVRNMQGIQGCDSIATYTIVVERLEDFQIMGDLALCSNAAGQLSAGNFAIYTWSTGETSATINIAEAGQYAVTVTSAAGCIAKDEVQVSTNELEANITGIDPSCFGEADGSIRVEILTGTPPYTYQLSGSASQSTGNFSNLSGGEYEVLVTDSEGCALTLFYPLIEPTEFRVDLGDNRTVNIGETLTLSATSTDSISTYVWESDDILDCQFCPSISLRPTTSTNVRLTAANTEGCVATANILLTINGFDIYEPTAFSPNGDGVNDFFTLGAGESVSNIRYLRVFDRWGNLVFEITEVLPSAAEANWDGRFKNEEVEEGLYIWIAELDFIDGKSRTFSGEVMVFR